MDVSMRSDLVQVLLEVHVVYDSLCAANAAFRSYLNSEEHIVSARNQTLRNNRIVCILERGLELEALLDTLVSGARLVIEDIDKAAWAWKTQIEGIHLASRPELSVAGPITL